MADIGTALKTYLKTKTAVTDLIGTGADARIYEQEAKQGVALPYIVYIVYAVGSYEDLDGAVGVATNRIEVNCYAATAAAAYALAEAVRLAPLQGYEGTMGSASVFDISSAGGYETRYDRPTEGANTLRFWVSRDYIFNHTEST